MLGSCTKKGQSSQLLWLPSKMFLHVMWLSIMIASTNAFVPFRPNHAIESVVRVSTSAPEATEVVPSTTVNATDGSVSDLSNSPQEEDDESFDAFALLANKASLCLFRSEMQRNAKPKGSPAANWIDDKSAFALQKTMDRLTLTSSYSGETESWMRWLKAAPSPMVMDFSTEFRDSVDATLTDESLGCVQLKRDEFLSRLTCRIVVMPSGMSLTSPLLEPAATLVFGQLLFGGVTRMRLLGNGRTAGERTQIKAQAQERIPTWMMYGGSDRMYQAVDMGPAAVLEVLLLPPGQDLTQSLGRNMVIQGMSSSSPSSCKLEEMMDLVDGEGEPIAREDQESTDPSSRASTLSGESRNDAFREVFQSSVGGLQDQIDTIVRRVLDGRIIRPTADGGIYGGDEDDELSQNLAASSLEAEELSLLGLNPVRGLLLYGPPGCGKTALVREISRSLRARSPKIVSAPELLDRWVGGSEKLVRALFADAEAELAAHNGDASKSALHVVVIDEIDAVFRKRTSSEDSGEATRSSVVNQILAKLDGVNAIPNVLFIGMTNRRELLDDALLRPGRLEVQIEIPLPTREGRREILAIHFEALRRKGRLSKPLCDAIDGNKSRETSLKSSPRRLWKRLRHGRGNEFDLAADYATGGFSGADIAGLVRCAGSYALARARMDGSGVLGLQISLDDVKQAILEVKK